jgi:hypothetical protein
MGVEMKKSTWLSVALLLGFLLLVIAAGSEFQSAVNAAASSNQPSRTDQPVYTADGKLALPENYREWVIRASNHTANGPTAASSS